MWDLPGPGLEPVSPALAGGFLTTTVPPGKSRGAFLSLQLKWEAALLGGSGVLCLPSRLSSLPREEVWKTLSESHGLSTTGGGDAFMLRLSVVCNSTF